MKTKFTSIVVFLSFVSLISCREFKCLDNNPIFSNNLPESDKYKNELASQLRKASDNELFFFTDKVVSKNSVQLLYVSIKSDSLCATGILHINKPNQVLENLLKAKGMSYEGSMLKNLKYDIVQNDLIFKSVEAVVD